MNRAILGWWTVSLFATLANGCSSTSSTEVIGSSSSALETDIGGTRTPRGASIVDSPIGVPPGGGTNPPGGPVGFCYFTQIVGAFVRNTDYIKIDIDNKPSGAVWALYQSGGFNSPYATVHCITLDTFTGLDPNSYSTMVLGPGTAVQTGPTEVLAGVGPEWPAPPPPPPPSPSNFNFMGWVYGHMKTPNSATWIYLGIGFGPDQSNQHERGGLYVDEDSQPGDGCGTGPCSLTGKGWSFGGNHWISLSYYSTVNVGNFSNFFLGGHVGTDVCFIEGVSGDWSSPNTSVSVTQSGGAWYGNGSTGGATGEQVEFACYPLAQ